MTAREERGLELAKRAKIRRNGKAWIVPSQSGNGKYKVCLDSNNSTCTCPDFELRGGRCKHIFAVQFTIEKRTKIESDGQGKTTVTETVKLTQRVTYTQDWPSYNAAQMEEKAKFQELLHDLCQNVQEPTQTMGRKRHSLRDLIFSSTFKVYSTVSSRRFMSDLQDAQAKGYLTKAPHYSSFCRCLENPDVTPIFKSLITQSSLPLKTIESQFAVDASGFSTCRTVSWYDYRYGQSDHDDRGWLKAHLMVGTRTNIVTSVEVTGPFASDGAYFTRLVHDTAQNFSIKEVSADKGYSSHRCLEAVAPAQRPISRSNPTR